MEENEVAKYVEITQDGIGRLFFDSTPPNIKGLYTAGIETCVPIIVVGEKGLALIHNTGRISDTAIANEFKLLGKIKFWTAAYNPQHYPKGCFDQKLKEILAVFIEAIEEIAPDSHLKNSKGKLKLYATSPSATVRLERNGQIKTNGAEIAILEPPNKNKRHRLNILNNYFMKNQFIPGDLQFNGSEFTPDATPVIPLKKMVDIARENSDDYGLGILKYYLQTFEPQLLEEIEQEELASLFNVQELVDEVNLKFENKNTEKTLERETVSFFKKPTTSQWKKYPEERLVDRYVGHQVLFFTMLSTEETQAKNFTEHLKKSGFDAELKKAKDKPSIIVDLNTPIKKRQ